MKFFLDTANLDDIRHAVEWGIVDGVTTNPSLIAKEGRPIVEQIARICDLLDSAGNGGDVSAEVVGLEASEMVREGRELARIHKNVVVKTPLIREGIKATSILSKEGIRVNVTLCFSAAQALIAAKAGAYIVSPFVGRLDDLGQVGMELVQQIVTIYDNYDFRTQILATSLRTTNHVIDAAVAGAHIATMPLKTMDALFNHVLTDKGLEQFLKDHHRVFAAVPAL
jgi:transaldolase